MDVARILLLTLLIVLLLAAYEWWSLEAGRPPNPLLGNTVRHELRPRAVSQGSSDGRSPSVGNQAATTAATSVISLTLAVSGGVEARVAALEVEIERLRASLDRERNERIALAEWASREIMSMGTQRFDGEGSAATYLAGENASGEGVDSPEAKLRKTVRQLMNEATTERRLQRRVRRLERTVENYTQLLGLEEDQLSTVQNAISHYYEKRDELTSVEGRFQRPLMPEEFREQLTTLRKARDEAIQAVLDPRQQELFKQSLGQGGFRPGWERRRGGGRRGGR